MTKTFSARLAHFTALVLVFIVVRGSATAQSFLEPVTLANPADQRNGDEVPRIELDSNPAVCPHCNAPAPKPLAGCKTCCCGKLIDWSKFPATIRPMARPGTFFVSPTGPGYYSAWDHVTGECRPAAQKSGYAPLAINAWPFFDADWRYVEGLPCQDRTIVEQFKRLHLNDCWLLGLGGEYWTRYNSEHNSRLTERDNDFALMHVRQYADLWYRDSLRLYGEFIWADSFGEELTPVPPDVDRGDAPRKASFEIFTTYSSIMTMRRLHLASLWRHSKRIPLEADGSETKMDSCGISKLRCSSEIKTTKICLRAWPRRVSDAQSAIGGYPRRSGPITTTRAVTTI